MDDVLVDGVSCTIQGAIITGSVQVINGGTLNTTGATQISGSVSGMSSGDLRLQGTTSVLGDVSSESSPSSTIVVGSNAVLGKISLKDSGRVTVRGFVSAVLSENSGRVLVRGGTVGGGGIEAKLGSGNIVLCDANVTGSVGVIERAGNLLAEESSSCPKTTITGGILIEKGNGDARVIGANFTSGDLSVVDQIGDVTITSALLSDIGISNLDGSVTLSMIETDSDVGLSGITGSVSVSSSAFSGDVGIEGSTSVSVTGSSFANESVSVITNAGPVEFSSNTELSLEISENDDVTLTNNEIAIASISSNTGGVGIAGNTITELNCVDNMPPPVGSGNSILLIATGQCASF